MKLLNLYQPAIPSERAFVNSFNENLQDIAQRFWRDMNGVAPVFIITAVIVGLVCCWVYYGPYNNQPGRHYKPSHWGWFLLGCFVLALLVTFGLEHMLVKTTLNGAGMTMFWVALQNAVYSVLFIYLPMSFIWCKWLPTKAYRLF